MAAVNQDEFRLRHGPQDGAKVKRIGEAMPVTIYVGPKWLGDGFAAWSREGSERFPCRYVIGPGSVFQYDGRIDA